ncbi:Pantothenate synthetase [bioreactor metagenome]|uniref:pantoate--beta-alanine ligase (AMP-forming) n=1 Tax=bioreactor metagenome TaxID=1076179 RepID=A0A645E1Y2_9ZZZZ
MKIFTQPQELQAFALAARRAGKRIALVPTMGFLHDGHASLIDIARRRGDEVIVSIFVNPTQFGPTEDLDQYPRDFEHDCALCEAHGATVIFAPQPESMYASDRSVWVDESALSKVLCGQSRPIHFRGVLTVVAKLFNLAQPDVAVFGRKDAQQAILIRRMVRDLNFPVEIVLGELIRDRDGVALSSRNRYLSADERTRARAISQAVLKAQRELDGAPLRDVAGVVAEVAERIAAAGGRIDYVEARDAETLEPPSAQTTELLLAVAAFFGATRLIDNCFVKLEK